MSNKAIAFIALSKGKKPTLAKEMQMATGYKKQHISIMLAATTLKLEVVEFAPDHCTNPKVNWFSRRALRSAIEHAVKSKHTLIVYDLIKLLSNCSGKETTKRWQYLKGLPITIIDAVTGRNLNGFSNRDILSLTVYKRQDSRITGRVISSALKSSDHTSTPPSPKARKVGQRARTAQAVNFAKSLGEALGRINADLTKRKIKPTLQRIADDLNEMGIPTRRGGEWTATSVKRVQERLKSISK